MLPTLLQIGPVTITSLGLMTALGFFIGTFLIWKRGKEEYFDEEKLMDAVLLTALVGLVFSRTFFVLLDWQSFRANLADWFSFVTKPGFSWLGVLIGGLLSLRQMCQKNKWDFFKLLDTSTFGLCWLALFVSFGLFLDGDFIALFQVLFLLLILRLIDYFDKHYRTFEWYKNKRGEAAPGFVFLSFLGLFSFSRLVLLFFKKDVFKWQWSVFVNTAIMILSFVVIYLKTGKSVSKVSLERKKLGFDKKNLGLERKRKVLKEKNHIKTGMEAK